MQRRGFLRLLGYGLTTAASVPLPKIVEAVAPATPLDLRAFDEILKSIYTPLAIQQLTTKSPFWDLVKPVRED